MSEIKCEKCPIEARCFIINDFLGNPKFDEIKRNCCPLILCMRANYTKIFDKAKKILGKILS